MRNPLTKEALAKFCESKPSDERYLASVRAECAICQFLRANGRPFAEVNNTYWTPLPGGKTKFQLAPFFDDAVHTEPHTFGALASRLRA